MKVRIHPHAVRRMTERGCTRPEAEYTVKHGSRAPARFGRRRFTHAFAYNRKWQGRTYRRKAVEAFAVEEAFDEWLVITVIVKYA
jgi:hypothetical protein